MAKRQQELNAFIVSPDDPLAAAHEAVSAWIEEATEFVGRANYLNDVNLKVLPSGQVLVEAEPERARQFVLAAIARVSYQDHLVKMIQDKQNRSHSQSPALWGSHQEWPEVWGHRRQAQAVINTLLKRSLPFTKDDLIQILNWCNESDAHMWYCTPFGALARAMKRYASENNLDADLLAMFRLTATRFKPAPFKEAKRFAVTLDLLAMSALGESSTSSESEEVVEIKPAPKPEPAGTPGILVRLKRALGMLGDQPEPPTTPIGADQFPLVEGSPLRAEHELVGEMLEEMYATPGVWRFKISELASGRRSLALDPEAYGRLMLAAAERYFFALSEYTDDQAAPHGRHLRFQASLAVGVLMTQRFQLDRAGLFDWLLYLSTRPLPERANMGNSSVDWIAQVEREAAQSPLTEGERFVLWNYRQSLIAGPPLGLPDEPTSRLSRLIGDGMDYYLIPGEFWTDVVNQDIPRLDPATRSAWGNLLRHALSATAAKPSGKWLKEGGKLIEKIGADAVRDALSRWLPLVSKGRSAPLFAQYPGDPRGTGDIMNDENATILRGLLWLIPTLPDRNQLARTITGVAISAYKKVPGIGPRAVKVGNSAVYALSELGTKEAVGQLAMLKVRVKFGSAQKEIEKAFNATAEALGLPRDQIEELGIPTYGLEDVGIRRETFGDYRAELLVNGSHAELHWFDAKGKALKSVPAKVKTDHKEDLKELQQALKDIQSMLPAQRDRIDGLFLQQKSWPFDDWRERYLDHPLVGTIARRLIWCVNDVPFFLVDGQPTDVQGQPIILDGTATVTLWHPVGRPVEEIIAWRQRLETLEITQPFKQAHREVYLLTDAERNTRTYSNRYAAHVIRQHQFNALCAARAWKNKLRLMVDDTYPPASRELPNWGLRAEFWIEGIGDNYGVDTNDAGSYLRLVTDQVRFYQVGASQNWVHASGGGYSSNAMGPGRGAINEPIELELVPPLVFSEIMRDVDLFVGVASVGNDPTWQDGGPEGRYRAYWQNYSFGALSGTATTRKQVLERLIPRLKIASRCSFSDRFLVVRGEKRTYKIHLGSGNILMEPNDQYLCIVPDSRARANQDDLFLPFEGDNVLSIIISKAFLLADDTKIKDPTITRQIDQR